MAVVAKRKRPIGWSEMETKLLICLWSENISDLRRTKRNRHIYEKIRSELEVRHQIDRTASEVKNKIDNLTKFYRREKKLKESSDCDQSEWEFYSQIDGVLSSCPIQEDDEGFQVIAQDVTVVLNSSNNCNGDIYDVTPTSTCRENTSASENGAVTTSPRRRKNYGKRRDRKDRFAEEVLSTVQSILQRQLQVEEDLQKNNDAALKLLERQTELQERSVEISQQMVGALSKFLQE